MAAKIAVGALASCEQLAGRLLGRLGAVAADPDQLGVELDAGALEGAAEAALAQPGRLEVGAAGEEADAAVPELEQVLGRPWSRPARLSESTVGSSDGPALWSTATTGARLLDVDARRGDQDRAVGQRAVDAGQVALLPARAVLAPAAAREDDQLVAGVADRARPRPSAARR